jgi:Ran GTPase-activating protein (RanGAP) involved in mRNA processing and transport
VSQNNLDDAGSAIIFDACARCSSLEVLYAEDNKASFMAGKSLAKLLDGDETNSKLTEVHVGWNVFRGAASLEIALALQKNYNLKILDVSWNNFGATETCAAMSQVGDRKGDLVAVFCICVEFDIVIYVF